MARYIQDKPNNYITTYTGKKFDYINITDNEIDIIDIAMALSKLCRFGGHIQKFYSVGEHSIHCAHLAKRLGLSKRIQLLSLIHDFSEAYCIDIPSPLKDLLDDYKDIEHNVFEHILNKFGIKLPTQEEYDTVKVIDNALLMNEMYHLKRDYNIEIADDFKIDIMECDMGMDEINGELIILFYELMESDEDE